MTSWIALGGSIVEINYCEIRGKHSIGWGVGSEKYGLVVEWLFPVSQESRLVAEIFSSHNVVLDAWVLLASLA